MIHRFQICFYVFFSMTIHLFGQSNNRAYSINKGLSEIDITQNGIAQTKSNYPLIKGEGIVICQKENLADTTDVDLLNRFISSPSASKIISVHATNVAKIMVGNGLSQENFEGLAPKARIISTNFNSFFPNTDKFYIDNGISIVNHSYGNEIDNRYSEEARDFDAQVFRFPYLLHLFSSGNSGNLAGVGGSYQGIEGFSNLTGDYKMSKNTVSVGACNSQNEVISTSSRGPTFDGRIKPEVVAYSEEGTSFAVAVVSGTASLLQDFFKRKYKTLPAASLLKTILIASAKDIAEKGPDYASGFGVINSFKAMKTLENEHFFEGVLKPNEATEFKLNVPKGVKNLRICIAWADPVAKIGANKVLVNDLDIELRKETSRWLPWVLSKTAHLDSLKKKAAIGKDTLNNVELITLDSPEAGIYIIYTKAKESNASNQNFHIAYYLESDDVFTWVWPQKDSFISSNALCNIQWESTLGASGGVLEYLTKNKTWEVISSAIQTKSNRYSWNIGDFRGESQLRFSINGQVFLSDKFYIEPRMNLEALYSCGDSTKIHWSNLGFGVKYDVQKLSKTSLQWQSIKMTEANNMQLKGGQNEWISVIPIFEDNHVGKRSIAINATKSNIPCFIESFNAFYDASADSCYLSVNLFQTDEIQKIIFQKQIEDSFQVINEQKIRSNQLNYVFTDSKIDLGITQYRVQIMFQGNNSVYAPTQKVIKYSDRKKYQSFIYPNPINEDFSFTILLDYTEEMPIRIYDSRGVLLSESLINQSETKIQLPHLSSGLYLCKVGDKIVEKIIVE